MMTLSEYIQARGETQADLAKRLGWSKSFLSEVLSGDKSPSFDRAMQVEKATGGLVKVASWPKFASVAKHFSSSHENAPAERQGGAA